MRAKPANRGGRLFGGMLGGAGTGIGRLGRPVGAETTTDECSWMDTSKSPETRAQELVAAITLDDKILMRGKGQ